MFAISWVRIWKKQAKVEGRITFLSGAKVVAAFQSSMKVCLAEFKFSVPISLLIYFRNKWNLEVRNDEQIFLSGLLVFKGLFCSYGN